MTQVQNTLIERVIQKVEHLPTLPQVVTKVLAMTDSAHVNAVELSKEMDQTLSAKVLKVANSAYYGGRTVRKVNSVHHAIVIIGFDALKEIILTTSLFHTFQDSKEIESLRPLWQHSLECGLAAKRLAWVFRYEAMDEAYLVGLIHDIGTLIIQQYFPDQFRLLKKQSNGVGEDLGLEREILGMTHAEIAGKVAEQWNFPETLVEAIAHHHDENWQLNPKLGRILFYADHFVMGMVDFHKMLDLFRQAGMNYPMTWKDEELKKAEDMLKEEIQKASSMLVSSQAPNH
ncbi:MAG: HDOD domain-containing protein [Deltaproteobacteria bacterium]|nr:HDOD domain-containing protein [Deltaproteobacteria bacterium]